MLTIRQLNIYPIKSTRGISLSASRIEPRGLQYDRRWAIFDQHKQVMTARDFPKLLAVHTTLEDDGLTIQANGRSPLFFPFHHPQPTVHPITLFSASATGAPLNQVANDWFSDYLGVSCSVYFMNEASQRDVLPKHGGQGEPVSFADECPILLLSEASVADLNGRLTTPITSTHFRPNIVVAGGAAYQEDQWTQVRIGDCVFDVVQACKRCVFTTIDPETHTKHPEQEPLKTLATYRRLPEGGVPFGVHLIPRQMGKIQVNDQIFVD